MAQAPKKEDQPEQSIPQVPFDEALKRMLGTPPQPRTKMPVKEKPQRDKS